MKKILLGTVLMAAAFSANATVFTFNGTGANLSSKTYTSGDLSFTVTAKTKVDSWNDLATDAGYVTQQAKGLGVASSLSSSSNKQLANKEELIFTFNKAVTFSSLTFGKNESSSAWTDSNNTFYINNTAVKMNTFLNGTGANKGLLNTAEISTLGLTTAKNTWTFVNTQGNDADKSLYVASMNVNVSPVPEAEEWSMMMLGLGLVGFMAKRKKALAA